ncbi:hypothetical protein ACC722_38570, partial [Rhizobium ruizarguesonis]
IEIDNEVGGHDDILSISVKFRECVFLVRRGALWQMPPLHHALPEIERAAIDGEAAVTAMMHGPPFQRCSASVVGMATKRMAVMADLLC